LRETNPRKSTFFDTIAHHCAYLFAWTILIYTGTINDARKDLIVMILNDTVLQALTAGHPLILSP